MKRLFDLIRRSLGSRDVSHGIGSFRDWRFYPVMALLLASTLCFARDPYFLVCGEFVYRQGVVVLLLALVIAAAFA